MVGWIEYIGRLINFAVQKIAGNKIDLSMDDRRRAARKFLTLYHAVSDLEVLSQEVMIELRAMTQEEDPAISREWLRETSNTIDETSQRFLEATHGLFETLKIFDPILASTVSGLEASKFSFLLVAVHGFERTGDDNEVIQYTQPSDEANSFDLAENYKWYAENDTRSGPIEWPERVALSFVDMDDTKSDRLNLRDPASMTRLADLIELHIQSLSAARESLAKFLRENFKFEDVLALQRPISQFDRTHVMHRMSDSVGIPYMRMFAGKPMRTFPLSRDKKD
ncbi:MAG: hypothetical protein WA639_21645 [Candidatus Acidiferrum sp.]